MSFDQKSLELFVRVAGLGAMGKAGQEMGLSPTATTQRIQALEHEVGARLFTRTTRAIALTGDGELFLGHAKRILANMEDARSELAGGGAVIKGDLRVTGSASFGRRYIGPYITEFLERYPEINVRLELTDTVFDIIEQGFDVALRIGSLPSSSLIARKLADNKRLLVAAPSYLARAGHPRDPHDLLNHNCIVIGEQRVWRLKGGDGDIQDMRVSGNFATNFGESATQATLAGNGIAQKSLWDVHDLLRDGALVPVLPRYTIDPQWALWAVRPPSPIVPARVRVFIAFMEEKFKQLSEKMG